MIPARSLFLASTLALASACTPMNPSIDKDLIVEPIAPTSGDEPAVLPARISYEDLSKISEGPTGREKLLKLISSRTLKDPATARHWLSDHQVFGRKELQGRAVPEDYRLYRVSLVLLDDGRYELLLKVGAELNQVRNYFRDKGRWKLHGDNRVALDSTGGNGLRVKAAIGIDGDDSAALFLRFLDDIDLNVGGEPQRIQLRDKVLPLRFVPGKLDENI